VGHFLNVFDKYCCDQLHFFHVVPGRAALLSVNLNY
jgi:hypothetical protein